MKIPSYWSLLTSERMSKMKTNKIKLLKLGVAGKGNNIPEIKRAYENLAHAIIIKAVEDYKMALSCNAVKLIRDCESFFKSDYFLALTEIDGKTLMRKIRTEVSNDRKRYKVYSREDS